MQSASGSGLCLERTVTVVIHVDLRSNSAESEMVSNDEGIHIVILRQIRIGILELANLLRIEHMNMTLIMAQLAILPEGIDQLMAK